jgi:thioredoxin-like negative regulator of GroEL
VNRNSPAAERVQVAEWLFRSGEPQRVLDTLPLETVRRHGLLLQYHLEALATLGRWDDVREIVEDPQLSLHPLYASCFLAVLDHRKGRDESAAAHLLTALAVADWRPDSVRLVARYAELAGSTRSAIAAHEKLMSVPGCAIKSAAEIVRLAGPIDDVLSLKKALRRLLEFDPGNDDVKNSLVYLNCLLDNRDAANRSMAEELVRRHPTNFSYRVTLALVELRDRNNSVAVHLLEREPVDWDTAGPRAQVVYAAALGATMDREGARGLARNIDVSKIRGLERELIKAWLPEASGP